MSSTSSKQRKLNPSKAKKKKKLIEEKNNINNWLVKDLRILIIA
jgi:hypothetical protein